MFDNKKKKNNEKWVKMVEGFWYGKEKDLKNPEMMYKQKNSHFYFGKMSNMN